jgi:hypothetical protein
MEKIQVIKTKCCGAIFSMCCEPECYTDEDYTKELNEYVTKGCTVEMVEKGKAKFGEKCICNNL